MRIIKDLAGQRFGRLLVSSVILERGPRGHILWHCICDCGNKTIVPANRLIYDVTKSCGCLRTEITIKRFTTHGMCDTPEYNTWVSMIQRCTNPNNQDYSNYGGRGITVCDRWLNSFEAFYEDMGSKPGLEYSLDREENDLGYCKDNCRWATPTEQANNQRTNVFYLYKGNPYTVPQLSKLPEAIENGVSESALYRRINKYNYSIEEAINTPAKISTAYTYNNITKPISEWAREYGINRSTLHSRLIRDKWDFERVIKTI